jgi:hypothetical protein
MGQKSLNMGQNLWNKHIMKKCIVKRYSTNLLFFCTQSPFPYPSKNQNPDLKKRIKISLFQQTCAITVLETKLEIARPFIK